MIINVQSRNDIRRIMIKKAKRVSYICYKKDNHTTMQCPEYRNLLICSKGGDGNENIV